MNQEDVTEVPINKKQNSYTYWVNNDPNQVKIDCKPQQVQDPSLLQNQQAPSNGFSQWNSMGTWEERNIKPDEIKQVIEQFLSQPFNLGNNLVVLSVTSVSGEATQFLSRGKKRLGFHLKIEYEFEGLNDLDGESGTIKYTDFTDDGDRDYNIQTESTKSQVIMKQIQENIEKLNKLTLDALTSFKQ